MEIDLITQRLKLKEIFPDAVVTAYSQKYGVPKEDIEFIRKGYTPTDVKFVEGEKAAISYINTAAVDRDAEVTLPEGGIMDAYMDNPVVMFLHDYKNLPIGKCDSLKLDAKGWVAKTVYANTAKATEVYEYRRGGFPLAESIGFIPIESLTPNDEGFDELAKDLVKRGAFKRGDIEKIKRIHSKWVMLEYSDVPIPSNPEALQIAIAKGLVLPEVKELVTKPEETDEYIRIPVDSGNHGGHRIRTIDISEKEGIKALYCGTDKVVMTYLFAKDKGWDTAKARAWIKEHGKKTLDLEHEVSQEEIADEMDYLSTLITTEGISDKIKPTMWILIGECLRLAGDDIPVDIKNTIKPVPKTGVLESTDILEAIKRIAKT